MVNSSKHSRSTGWLLGLENLENLEIRPGGLDNLEKQVFFSGKP